MVEKIEQISICDWKEKVYNIDYRPKINYNFSNSTLFKETIPKLFMNKPYDANPTILFGSKEEFLHIMQPFIKKNT